MLRADAPSFTPKASLESSAPEDLAWEELSTAAPSPEMTACMTPFDSPWAGYYVNGQWPHLHDSDLLLLPEAEEVEASEFELQGLEELHGSFSSEFELHGLAELHGSFSSKFHLQGLEELHSSLVDFVKTLDPAEPGTELAPPPGLDFPPGLSAEEQLLTPPGLDAVEHDAEHSQCAHAAEKHCKQVLLPSGCTTAMLRNIPNKYSRAILIKQLHKDFKGDIDFLYLPVDFKNHCNMGYCFLNFRTPQACARFAAEFHNMESRAKLPGFNSKKVCEVSPARVQGCESNVRRLRCSPVIGQLVDKPEWMPQLFDEQGEPVEFPSGDGPRRR